MKPFRQFSRAEQKRENTENALLLVVDRARDAVGLGLSPGRLAYHRARLREALAFYDQRRKEGAR